MAADRIEDFGEKLTLVLKTLNMSRGRLAAQVGVDKSLVGRWASGQVQPSSHNLAKLSQVFAAAREGFNALLWEQPVGGLAAFLGLESPKEAPSPPEPGYELKSGALSREEIALWGRAYPGIYALFRHAFSNTGNIIVEAVMLQLEGDRLLFSSSDGFFEHSGHVLLMRRQLYLFGESDSRQDGMTFTVLHGVGGARALVLDGLQLSVAADRHYTPTAGKVLMLRVADLTGDPAMDRLQLEAAWGRVKEINTAREGSKLLPTKYASCISNLAGIDRPDGTFDWTLRLPAERSVALSDTEAGYEDLSEAQVARELLGDQGVFLKRNGSIA